jgi:hypothetical protein
MAMVPCKTCGKEIAKGAICPACGRNNKNAFLRFYLKHPIRNTIIFIFLMAFLEILSTLL